MAFVINGSITATDSRIDRSDQRVEGVRSFSKARLMKHRGADPAKFPFYLKELEFRYTCPDADLFDQLIGTPGEYTRGQ